MPNKPTDAELMTGFNPAFGVTAEEIEAQQAGAEPSGTEPESDGEDSPKTEGQEAASSAAPEVEVTLDGRTFKAPQDIATAFTREINRRDGTRGAELQTLRERLARLEGATAPNREAETVEQGPQLPNPELQIEDPDRYQRELLAHIEHKQTLQTQALAQRYEEAEATKERESARQKAWAGHVESFYSKPENAVLRGNEDIVDLVLSQNREALASLDVEAGFKALADLAKQRLAKLTGSAPEVKARQTPRPAVLEGSARRGDVAVPAARKDEGPRSLTQALKERRKQAAAEFAKGALPRPSAAR